MIRIIYAPRFLQQLRKLEKALQDEAAERVVLFLDNDNHETLRVHKLKGALKGLWSFSVNYKYRIIFQYIDKNTVAFLTIGDHDIYK